MSRVVVVVILGVLCFPVESSHFRGGIIMVRPQPGGVENEMEISYRISWRRDSNAGGRCDSDSVEQERLLSGEGSMTCQAGCSGTITPMSYICTDFSTTENWSFGENRLSFIFSTSSSVFTITFSGSAWIAPFNSRWNIPTTFSTTRRNDTGRINSTPRAITAPVIRLQHGCNHTLPIAVSDPDGDVVRCRWAVGSSECGGVCNRFPNAILDPATCTFTYEANGATGFNAVAIMVEDFIPGSSEPLSSVALQFLVFVFSSTDSCSSQPRFVPPTFLGGSCVAIPSGATFTTEIIANSGGNSVSITEFQTTSPLGLRRSEIQQLAATDNYYINVTWTPQPEQENETHLFCYTAVNSARLVNEQNCIQLLSGSSPPQPLLNTAKPNQDLVHPHTTVWTLSFDQTIKRPILPAFIKFFNAMTRQVMFRIDTSISSEIIFSNSSISISPSYQFLEKTAYFITLDWGIVNGFQGCGPGNEPINDELFWTFETMDITPPVITLINNPSRSNRNISISWISNEEVAYVCILRFEDESDSVNCSQALWTGRSLNEGAYQLMITATDLANNSATVTHNFVLDLTPPEAFINQRPALISNVATPRFSFSCSEICTFECSFNAQEFSPCNSRFYFTPSLEHNKTYTFAVVSTDDVGNRGQEVSYTWETDFENPQISTLSDISVLCFDIDPSVIGIPVATDNQLEEVAVTYSDSRSGCVLERTWTATDVAGNTNFSVQLLFLVFNPSISFVPTLTLSCDSISGTFSIPQTTASASNPCQLPLDLSFMDSVSQFTCPGEFTRNWTAQACGNSTTAAQLIRFFDTCPPNACGRNESPPRGICSFGECSCNRPWFGTNCSRLIYEPEIGMINNTILEEAESYVLLVPLIQGTPPLSWALVSGPEGLRFRENMQRIVWTRAQAGNHTVTVRVENEVGVSTATWTLSVKPGYTATIDPVSPSVYPQAQPVTLTGRVEYFVGNAIEEAFSGVVVVSIDISRGGSRRTVTALTEPNGLFTTMFYPASTEYGSYAVGARHPQSPSSGVIEGWLVLGMRSIPSSISLFGEILTIFQQTFYNTTMICNDGPGNLTGLHISTNLASSDHLQVTFSPSETFNLNEGHCTFIDISISASRSLSGSFLIIFETDQGTSTSAQANIQIQQILPRLVIDPPRISSRLIRGMSSVYQFNITNVGRTVAHNIEPVIPNTPVFSFISLGNSESSYGDGQFNLDSGESASLSIQAMVSEDTPLGEISASLYIVSDEVSQQIPVSLTVSSDLLMNLTIVVEDEYTYFASGAPLVSDAVVTLINYQRDLRTTLTTEEGEGSVIFTNIFEDRYEVFIEASSHRSLQQVVITSIDNPVLTFFLERQAVTYSWSVTPVTFEDTYVLTLEADFETNVPIPVVTVTPAEFDLEELELNLTNSIQLNITNHGLIRADNININLPTDHPFLEFTVDNEVLGDLEALSSVTAVVRVSRKNVEKRAAQVVWILYIINIAYSYVCGTRQLRSIPVVLRRREIIETVIRPPPLRCSNCGGSISLGGSSSGGPVFSFNGYSASTPAFCNDCLQTVVSCFPTPNFPGAGCLPKYASGELSDITDFIGCAIGDELKRRLEDAVNRLTGSRRERRQSRSRTRERLNRLRDILEKGYDLYNACSTLFSGSSRRKRQSLLSTVQDHLESMYPIDLSIIAAVEVLGDDLWLSVGDSEWVSMVLKPVLDDGSEDGSLISETELATILAVQPPSGTTVEDIERLSDRLNNTISGWNSGVLEPVDDSNMASYSFLQFLTDEINQFNQIAISKGFESYLDAYTFSANELNQLDEWDQEEGICAVVRIRIEQELAITREAFLARLEIENQEDMNLEQMSLEIMIMESTDGSNSVHLFAISNETLSGSLVRAGDSWTLMSGGSGSVEWLIVPLSEAAPQTDRVYAVGGTLRYTLDNENITIPLLPTLITVTPDPSLLVHYFWERNVIGDDPFTDEVEPSIPFTLGVIVKNAGYGVASSLTLSSGQPEIIENERGLLINFMITGAQIGNGSITPSLSLTLGDLSPQSTVVVRWFMVSSLQGEFKNFSATYQNINPLGDSRLSILDELEIHELSRNVRIYGEGDDGILDFLVNQRRDIGAFPDALYDSKSLTRYIVTRGEMTSTQLLPDSTSTLMITTVSNESGWVYYRYTDIRGYLTQPALTLNTTKQTPNGLVQIPPENSWITFDTDNEILVLHLFDFVESTNETDYIVSLCTSNCTAITIPFTRPTGTPPPTMMPTTASTAELLTTTDETTSLLVPPEIIDSIVKVTLYEFTVEKFDESTKEIFKETTVLVINEYCSKDSQRCEKYQLKSRRQVEGGLTSDSIILLNIRDEGVLTFLMYAAVGSGSLSANDLQLAIEEGKDIYANAGFSRLLSLPFTELGTEAPDTTNQLSIEIIAAIAGSGAVIVLAIALILLCCICVICRKSCNKKSMDIDHDFKTNTIDYKNPVAAGM